MQNPAQYTRFKLSAASRKRLKDVGLSRELIDVVESNIPIWRGWLWRRASLRETRAKLEGLKRALSAAQAELQTLDFNLYGHDPVLNKTLHALSITAAKRGRRLPADITSVTNAIDVMATSVDRTLADLANQGPTRHKFASPMLVLQIHTDLDMAWRRAQFAGRVFPDDADPYAMVEPWPVVPASSPTSDFFQIISLIYELLGEGDDVVTPERAIRAFVRSRTRSRVKQQK